MSAVLSPPGYRSIATVAAILGLSRQRVHQLRAVTGRRGLVTDQELAALVGRVKGRGGRPKGTRKPQGA